MYLALIKQACGEGGEQKLTERTGGFNELQFCIKSLKFIGL